MNEQLQNALALILGKTVTAAQAGAEFLMAELPDVIHQLLIWKAIMSGLQSLLAITLTVVGVYGYYRLFKWDMKNSSYGEKGFPSFLGGIAGVAVLTAAGFLFSMDWLQILIAPKIYLIEYAASLTK